MGLNGLDRYEGDMAAGGVCRSSPKQICNKKSAKKTKGLFTSALAYNPAYAV